MRLETASGDEADGCLWRAALPFTSIVLPCQAVDLHTYSRDRNRRGLHSGKAHDAEVAAGDRGELLDCVEGVVEQINGTLRQLSAGFDSMERHTTARFYSLDERISWMTGLQFVTVFALGALILLKL